jgi:hypothetical protein
MIAATILVGQLPKLFGFKVDPGDFLGTGFVKGLAHGETVAVAAAAGTAGIALILVLQRWLPKVPAVLIMVILAIAATTVFSLADHGVSLVGVLPKGFPPLTIPHIHAADLGPLLAGAAAVVFFWCLLWGPASARPGLIDLLPFTALGWLGLGFIAAGVLRPRRPDRFEALGRISCRPTINHRLPRDLNGAGGPAESPSPG